MTGLAALRAYWWPNDRSHTTITSFTRTITEIGGTSGFAFVRGTGTVGWISAKKGAKPQAQTSLSTDFVVYGQDVNGRWRVVRQMWSALP